MEVKDGENDHDHSKYVIACVDANRNYGVSFYLQCLFYVMEQSCRVFIEESYNFLHKIWVGIVLQILQLKELLLVKVFLQHSIP